MRGLKQQYVEKEQYPELVASFTDAWIETPINKSRFWIGEVASFTDAWIETN